MDQPAPADDTQPGALKPVAFLPKEFLVPVGPHMFGGGSVSLTLRSGLTVFLGPNGSGKTQVLRSLKTVVQEHLSGFTARDGTPLVARLLAAGRGAPFEPFRSASSDPYRQDPDRAAVGHATYRAQRHAFESLTGDMLGLHERPDLRLKVEARLQALFQRRLRLEWTQNGLAVNFVSPKGEYSSALEASGVLQVVGLLAALHDDHVGAVLIDEPEISLHPQLQAFLLDEVRRVSGDPGHSPQQKLVVLATHAEGMLPLRRIEDLPDLVFFSNANTKPMQISPSAGELRRKRLATLVAGLGASHRGAFFATTVLLVEGPSDQIVLSALAARFGRSLGGSGTEVVPVLGKTEMAETARLFRLMGKRVIALADLDALADDRSLVESFSGEEGAKKAAVQAGHKDALALDQPLRDAFAKAVAERWTEIESLAAGHRYLAGKALPEAQDKRRAALAALLSADEEAVRNLAGGEAWIDLRARFEALLRVLAAGGCFVLRRGTIEDYYDPPAAAAVAGKPEAAVAEAVSLADAPELSVGGRYVEALQAIECAAPSPPVDENAFLRKRLASVLAAVFQILTHDTTPADIALETAAHGDAGRLFALEKVSSDEGAPPALRVAITSPLFFRANFPATIQRDQNLHSEVKRLLP